MMDDIEQTGRQASAALRAEVDQRIDVKGALRAMHARPRATAAARSDRVRRRRSWFVLAGVVAIVVTVAVTARSTNDREKVSTLNRENSAEPSTASLASIPLNPAASDTEQRPVSSIGTTPTTNAPSSLTTLPTPPTSRTSATATTAHSTQAPALIVHPFGSRSDVIEVGVTDANVTTQPAAANAGDVALTYELQIGFDPHNLASTIETPTATADGQLTIETSCATPDCLSLQPVNDRIQTKVKLTVRRTTVPLNPGEHDAPFAIHFTYGTTEKFTVGFYAEPAPSESISSKAAALTGPPTPIQTVFDVGRFDYHMVSAFGSIWLLGQASRSVTRIDAITGAVLASIPIEVTSNRLTAAADAIYVAGDPVLRIDPTTNTVTPLTPTGLTVNARAIIADGQTLWAASLTGGVYRIDPDGTVATVQPASPAAWVDLAVSHGKVWALGRDTDGARLVSFDEATSSPVDNIIIPFGPNLGIPARLVADERDVVVGIDPRTGGGNGFQSNGELVIVDPVTATITATVPLATRPEGIVLTDRHIWTSGAVLDRTTLAVTPISLGFTITRGPDGSIWATNSKPGTADATSIAIRFAPGDSSG